MIDELIVKAIKVGELPECSRNTKLAERSWIHRGGDVKYWWSPKNTEELVEIGRFLFKHNQKFITIGHTSNIYFKDSFKIDHIIDTKKLTKYEILIDENLIVCDCGVHMSKLSMRAVINGYAGFEGMINLPGTVGGAIVNNSGCYECGIDKVLKSIDLLTEEGVVLNLKAKDLEYSFRTSNLKTGKLKGIILRAFMDISVKESSEKLIRIAEDNTKDRIESQDPPANNLGTIVNVGGYNSNFKNAIIRGLLKAYKFIDKSPRHNFKLSKSLILTLYNKRHLSKYISDKRMGCYIWNDKDADMFFDEYLDLIRSVYKHSSIEIEVFS